jgi:hypothetical protein
MKINVKDMVNSYMKVDLMKENIETTNSMDRVNN